MIPRTLLLDGEWMLSKNGGEAIPFPVPGSLKMLEEGGSGVYVYERRVDIPADAEGRCFLCIDGADYAAQVFVNGILLGSHEGASGIFRVEATNAIRRGEENLLTVRIVFPEGKVLEGINGPGLISPNAGGGLFRSVHLKWTGSAVLKNVQVWGDLETGKMKAFFETDGASSMRLNMTVSSQRTEDRGETICKAGKQEFSIPVEQVCPWTPENPFLYTVTLRLFDENGALSDEFSVRTGFRDFRVNERGEFCLNGKRIFLKCAHGAKHTPYPIQSSNQLAMMRQFIATMKAAGFNCVRFLQATLRPEILDFCDEIGMMVYQEHLSSWVPCGYPAVSKKENCQPEGEVERIYYHDLANQIEQDRNHVSIILWGLLNETIDCRRNRAATVALPLVRSLDQTRLVLCSSGSWGADLSRGSVCNPFGTQWECLWGEEGTGKESVQLFEDKNNRRYNVGGRQKFIEAGYYTGAGDAHCYPCAQVNSDYFNWMEQLGHGAHPVFLSEFGVGSQFDYWGLARLTERLGNTPENRYNYNLSHANDELLKRFIREYGLETIYPTAHCLILDSYAEQKKYRDQVFSMIRANPRIIGYSMTAVQDHGYAGEGFIGLNGDVKPGHMETMQNGWASLRWCLLTDPTHFYNDEPVRLRAVLADEDVLAPGSYPVTLSISNDDGIIWKKETTVSVPEDENRPYSHTVFDEKIVIEGLDEGEYVFRAVLEESGPAQGGEVTFDVQNRAKLPKVCGTVQLVGTIPEKLSTMLQKQGVEIVPFAEENNLPILGGVCADGKVWDAVWRSIARGNRAALLDACSLTKEAVPFAFLDETREAPHLRFEEGAAQLVSNWEWLYHRMPIAKPDPVLKGVKARGILDQNYYNNILSQWYFVCPTIPKEPIVMAFAMNTVATSGVGPICGIMLGRNTYGKGKVLFGTLDLLPNVGHPAADRLILNQIAEIQG